jgi:hypothetical protein
LKYAAYITRADHWYFEAREVFPITNAEWLAYTALDPDIQPVTSLPVYRITGTAIKEAINFPVDGYWEWIAYSKRPERQALFEYHRAGIIVRVPDQEILQKAISIARALGGRVIGDDDDVFGDTE